MKLKYRGVTYSYTPPTVEMEPSKIVGQYRGLDWRFRNPKRVSVQQPTLNLMYRGVAYQTGASGSSTLKRSSEEVSTSAPATSSISPGFPVRDLARGLLMGHHKRVQRRQQAMLSRSNDEIGLDANAEQYWSATQGKVPSENWSTYDRSSVSLS